MLARASRDLGATAPSRVPVAGAPSDRNATGRGHALIVSHACVVPANQSVFGELASRGWAIDLVVPNRWTHEYGGERMTPALLPGAKVRLHGRRVALAGRPQRHVYTSSFGHSLGQTQTPRVAFLEEESFSVPAFQWGLACWRRGVPFGVQAAENLDRDLPLLARVFRAWTLRHAAFVAARSPMAKRRAEEWGAQGRVEVIPHAVPEWEEIPRRPSSDVFTVGFAGRLVEEKGVRDLVAAAGRLHKPTRVLFVGDGKLRAELTRMTHTGVDIEILSDVSHQEMARAYSRMDVLVLPSRSTPTWTEQFGRVLVEALWCGVPVVGSESGEIPWVVTATGGGICFPEGNIDALASVLRDLEANPEKRNRLARTGREAVERLFSLAAVAEVLDGVLCEIAGGG